MDLKPIAFRESLDAVLQKRLDPKRSLASVIVPGAVAALFSALVVLMSGQYPLAVMIGCAFIAVMLVVCAAGAIQCENPHVFPYILRRRTRSFVRGNRAEIRRLLEEGRRLDLSLRDLSSVVEALGKVDQDTLVEAAERLEAEHRRVSRWKESFLERLDDAASGDARETKEYERLVELSGRGRKALPEARAVPRKEG